MTKAANFLKNSDKIGISEASEVLTLEALSRLENKDVKWFEDNYKTTLMNYLNDDSLRFSSRSFELDKLDSFTNWLNELVNEKNKYVPLIVAKMLKGDALAHSIYKAVYNNLHNEELVLSNTKMMANEMLRDAFLKSDGDANAEAILNGEYWLNSEEARDVLCSSSSHVEKLGLLLDHNC